MSLFNEYENKNLQFIINYINQINMGNLEALSADEIRNLLIGGKLKLTSTEIVDALLNQSSDEKDNVNILYSDSANTMQPIMPAPFSGHLPIFTSLAERSWLYYILQDYKSDLFINPGVKQIILSSLTDDDLIDIKLYVHSTAFKRHVPFSSKYIRVFRTLSYLLNNGSYATIEIKGQTVDILPLKIKYHEPNDTFTLFCLFADNEELADINIEDITLVEKSVLGKFDTSHQSFQDYLSDVLQRHATKYPIRVEILSDSSATRADDRFSHLFANFDTTTYEDSNGNLISEIAYYDFQYYEVLKKLLFLGKYIRILGPEPIKKEIQDIITSRTSLYQ